VQTVHAWSATIHPPIPAVHPEFDKPFTCGNASIRSVAGTLRALASARREDVPRLNAVEREIDSLRRLLAVAGVGSNRVSACVPQSPAERVGHSIMVKHNAFGNAKGFERHSVADAAAAIPNRVPPDEPVRHRPSGAAARRRS
jgi:hypothetical protein